MISSKDIEKFELEKIAEGARVKVYSRPELDFVVKAINTSEELDNGFLKIGISLKKALWASKLGKDPDKELIRRSRESYHVAERKLEGIAVPFILIENLKLRIKDEPEHAVRDCIVQKKAIVFGEKLRALAYEGRMREAEILIDELLNLILEGFPKRGVCEQVFNFMDDYGIFENRIMLMDIGELTEDKEEALSYIREKKILKEKSFGQLRKFSPELAGYLKEEAENRFVPERYSEMWEKSLSF